MAEIDIAATLFAEVLGHIPEIHKDEPRKIKITVTPEYVQVAVYAVASAPQIRYCAIDDASVVALCDTIGVDAATTQGITVILDPTGDPGAPVVWTADGITSGLAGFDWARAFATPYVQQLEERLRELITEDADKDILDLYRRKIASVKRTERI